MRMLSAILCRAFGHKPYSYPGLAWEHDPPVPAYSESRPVIITRCKRCDAKLGQRPMLAGEDEIQA